MIPLISMFILIVVATPILNIGNKSLGEYASYFLLGYFILSMEEVQERLKRHRAILAVLWGALIVWRCVMYKMGLSNSLLWNVEQRLLAWVGILAVLGLGRKYLEFHNKFTVYFTPVAFPLYIFHQSIIVMIGYFTIRHVKAAIIQYMIICLASFGFTLLVYELFKRIKIARFLFGIKK